ncbi:hypothetical protein BO94DRAFT_629336 [Aspergillus sclerotioniger CBS 115572]|uniref:N-acetyltransferase domain-containing protein n=1 Tax=Aspergillus sclerotioniger CBS 115572 TaxID=1450535 RepID=A0A317UW96_9EURO|nr:hypothetical protein BO94DRAFT_629336 [Aspergillus sclerotioniger CBS 115572]PWY64787.1 hypothetical protein BO94DRAFT_629336 [Aspergillus sclerotioniger CBS 115572]
MSSSQSTYTFFRIPKTDSIHTSAQKYRSLRLQALTLSPRSFSSTYEIESAFTETDWIDRLTVPDREVFICAATTTTSSITTNEWIGQVTLRGPSSATAFELPPEAGQPAQRSDDKEERWQMLSLFTLPEHRGQGLGGKLCQAALDWLSSRDGVAPRIQVRLIVKAGNDVTIALYRRLGFVHTGRATLVEALIANGDEHLVPVESEETVAMFRERRGLVMKKS